MNLYNILIKIIWIILVLFVIPVYFYVTLFCLSGVINGTVLLGTYIQRLLRYKTFTYDTKNKKHFNVVNKIFFLCESILILAMLLSYFFHLTYLSDTIHLLMIFLSIHIAIAIIMGLIYGSKLRKRCLPKKNQCCSMSQADHEKEES